MHEQVFKPDAQRVCYCSKSLSAETKRRFRLVTTSKNCPFNHFYLNIPYRENPTLLHLTASNFMHFIINFTFIV